MAHDGIKYLIDTDALSHIRHMKDSENVYKKLIDQVKTGNLKTVRQVFAELEKHPPVHKIVKPHKGIMLISADDQYSQAVKDAVDVIAEKAGFLYEEIGGKDPADPWLIAVSKVHKFTLVTDESSHSSKKIPAVCKIPEIACRCITSPHFLIEVCIVENMKPEHIDPHKFYAL